MARYQVLSILAEGLIILLISFRDLGLDSIGYVRLQEIVHENLASCNELSSETFKCLWDKIGRRKIFREILQLSRSQASGNRFAFGIRVHRLGWSGGLKELSAQQSPKKRYVRDDPQFEQESYVFVSTQPHLASRSLPRPRWDGETFAMVVHTSKLAKRLLD